MSQIQNQNPGSTEIQSPLIAGITEALNKISSVLSMNVGSLSDAQLTPVSIDESPDNQRRIYEAPQGSRLWLSEPVPVFKINGSVITQEQYSFSIDYVGGSITFTTSQKPSASDKVTVTASYIINQSKFVNDINSAVSDLEEKSSRYKGSFEDKDALILAYPSGENGDFAILFSPFAVYAWKNDGWYDTRSIEDLSDYYKKSEVDNLLNQKEPTIPNKGSSASDDNYYWGGRKTWQDLFAKVRSVTLTGLNTATSTAVTATDTVLSSIGKLQGQVNKIISDGFGFKSFSKSVFPEDKTGNIDPTSPMLMADLTATSAANRLDHVVIPGKTVQAGSGDPSPENVRPLSGVGQFGTRIQVPTGWNLNNGVFYRWGVIPSGVDKSFSIVCSIGISLIGIVDTNDFASKAKKYRYAVGFDLDSASPNYGRMYIKAPFSSVSDLNQWLTDSPQWIIYQSTIEPAQMYTWASTSGDTYAAVGIELDGPLFDGDSVNNNAETPSGRQCAVRRVKKRIRITGENYRFVTIIDKDAKTAIFRMNYYDAAADKTSTVVCNVCKKITTGSIWREDEPYVCGFDTTTPTPSIGVRLPVDWTLEQANQWLSDLDDAGNTFEAVFGLAIPTTTYSAAQPLTNPPGTWTLSAENTPQGYMRALSDTNHADVADTAKQADTAQSANTLGGKSLAQIAPRYSAAETAMPYTWTDGKTIYRRVYTLAKSDFTASTATYYLANGKNTTDEYTSTTLTKTGLLAGAAQILPMTQAAWMDSNFRPMPYNRLAVYNFNMGWRLDKSGSSWAFVVETGSNNLSAEGQIALIAYYTK